MFGFGSGGEDALTTAAGAGALPLLLFGFAEGEFSGYSAAVVIGLDHYGGI
jgi:hypothetical protein